MNGMKVYSPSVRICALIKVSNSAKCTGSRFAPRKNGVGGMVLPEGMAALLVMTGSVTEIPAPLNVNAESVRSGAISAVCGLHDNASWRRAAALRCPVTVLDVLMSLIQWVEIKLTKRTQSMLQPHATGSPLWSPNSSAISIGLQRVDETNPIPTAGRWESVSPQGVSLSPIKDFYMG